MVRPCVFHLETGVPRELVLVIPIPGKPDQSVTWNMRVDETGDVDGIPAISKATVVLWSPLVLPDFQVVHEWEADVIEKRPIAAADLTPVHRPGASVHHYILDEHWYVGAPESRESFDRAEMVEAARQARLGGLAPQARNRRHGAMALIVRGAALLTLAAGVAIYPRQRMNAGA